MGEMAVPARNLHFLDLPSELHAEIASHLLFPDRSSLRNTNRYFSSIIRPATHADLLAAEELSFFQRRQFYTCRYCVRLRPGSKFADNMKKAKKRYLGPNIHLRYCLDCGLHPESGTLRYSKGAYITINEQIYVICMDCSKFKLAGKTTKAKICEDCYDWRQKWMKLTGKTVFIRREYEMAQKEHGW